jgi:hypothetical protein
MSPIKSDCRETIQRQKETTDNVEKRRIHVYELNWRIPIAPIFEYVKVAVVKCRNCGQTERIVVYDVKAAGLKIKSGESKF